VNDAVDHDGYIRAIRDPAKRMALRDVRALIRARLPDCIEVISYAMPGFRQPGRKGKVVIGYAAFARHCAVYPHSGTVIPALATELEGWQTSKGGVLFTPERLLPERLIRLIIETRLKEIAG
jgi:uncharacterized protein YdhG (YjbR/CyaY superfamily)